MKRMFVLLLCSLMLLSLCACSAGPEELLPPSAAKTAPQAARKSALAPEPALLSAAVWEPAGTRWSEPESEPAPAPTPAPMRTRYVIGEKATGAPLPPDESCYGSVSLDEPEKALEVIQGARELGLLRADETVIFDPGVEFYRGADRQDIEYYLDETILVICWKEVVEGCTCSFAEIKIQDPSQFRRKLADDTFDSGNRYFSTEMHRQTNAVLSVNADFYQNRDVGLLVYDRTLYRFPEYTYTGSYTYTSCLENCFVNSRGEFLYTELGQNFSREEMEQFVADNDILFSIAFGPILIRDGQVQECSWYPVGEVNQVYSRAGLGIVDELHYLYMSLNHCPEKAGSWTVNQFARHFGEKQVRTAYCLDGGQTGEMVFRDRPYNHIDFGEERRVSDNLYFASAMGGIEILEPVPDRAALGLSLAAQIPPEVESFAAEEGEGAVDLLLSTDRRITSFTLLSLVPVEGENGLGFEAWPIYTLPELTARRPLLLRLSFPGDLPAYGFSYVDPDGSSHRCAIGLSGEDGSPLFWEF